MKIQANDFLNNIYHKALDDFNKKYKTKLAIGLYEATKHSFGTQLINKGIPEHLLQEWFGHTRPEMTRKYTKLKVVDAFRNIEKILKINKAVSENRQ